MVNLQYIINKIRKYLEYTTVKNIAKIEARKAIDTRIQDTNSTSLSEILMRSARHQ